MYQSETSKHRSRIEPFCRGFGCDIGFGGDPITDSAIRMDLPTPYAQTGQASVQLGGDCRNLKWFADEALDYVYSSHVLEDFPESETGQILREWSRILKVGGHLILLLPDQQRYLRHCRQTGQPENVHHSVDHFSAAYMRDTGSRVEGLEVLECNDDLGDYSFLIVFKKTASAHSPREAELAAKLETALEQNVLVTAELKQCQAKMNRLRKSPLLGPLLTLRGKLLDWKAGRNR